MGHGGTLLGRFLFGGKVPRLVLTTKVEGHRHVVWLREDFTGSVSIDKDHKHEVEPLPEGRGAILSPSNDHSHGLESDLLWTQKEDKKPDKDKVKDVRELFRAAKDNESDARKKAWESEKFYRGDQWEDADRQKLKRADRACLTINEIEPKIDLLSGYYRQNRQDIKFFPVEGSDARVAEILNVVVKNIFDTSNAEHEETDIFEDALITGRGCWHIYVDYDENLEGDIKLEHWPWADVYFGPSSKRDQKDLEYLCKSKWISAAKLMQLYPDKADDVHKELDYVLKTGEEAEGFIHDEQSGDAYSEPGDEATAPIEADKEADFLNIRKKEYRLIEMIRKEYERVPVAFNAEESFYQAVPASYAKSVRTIPGFRVVFQNVHRMRKMTSAGYVLLEDEYLDDYRDFNIIPIFAKKRGKYWWGKVESSKDPQREINKRHSQLVDIMNKCATYGYFYDDQTFNSDPRLEAEWKRNASSPGFNQKVASTDRPPKKEEGVRFPTELVNLEELSSNKLRVIMNLPPELLGESSRAESGVAIAEKKRQGLVGNEFLFDNLSLSKKRLGKVVVGLIQKVYTPERILRVIQSNHAQSPVEIGGQQFDQYQPEEIMALLQNTDLTKYDVAVGESAYSPTNRRYNFIVWSELAGRGVPVPPELLVDLSDLGEKDKVKAMIQAMMQAEMQKEQAKIDAEIQKTLISAQSKASSRSTE